MSNQNQQIEINQNNLIYRLNDDNKTVSVIGCSSNDDVFIPRSIYYKSQEYIVKRVNESSFKDSNIFSIQFAPDSEIQTIEKNAFSNSTIEKIFLPSSVSELESGWICDAMNLIKVSVMPNNEYFKNYDENLVIGKSDEFDVLIFARRDVKKIEIPKNIKQIASYSFSYSLIEQIKIPPSVKKICEGAFSHCKHLQSVEIPIDSELTEIEDLAFSCTSIKKLFIPRHVTKISFGSFSYCKHLQCIEFSQDSELKSIEQNAFYLSPIESLSIPSSVSSLDDGWCNETEYLNNVTIGPNSKHFIKYGDNLIIGKSDEKSDNFDVLIFANRNIKTVTIPSNIKKIASCSFSHSSLQQVSIPSNVEQICECAFSWCYNLQRVEIPFDSKLQSINELSFRFSSIQKIFIPSHVKQICDNAFSSCLSLQSIIIPPDSELQSINSLAFAFSSIISIFIPSMVTYISDDAFNCCDCLQIVEFDENSNVKSIYNIFRKCTDVVIMIPFKLMKQ